MSFRNLIFRFCILCSFLPTCNRQRFFAETNLFFRIPHEWSKSFGYINHCGYINLIVPRKQHEDYFTYNIIRMQKLYSINIWLYIPCCNGKVELLNDPFSLIKIEKTLDFLFGMGISPCFTMMNIQNTVL